MKTGIRYVCTDILLIIINSISQAMGNGDSLMRGIPVKKRKENS